MAKILHTYSDGVQLVVMHAFNVMHVRRKASDAASFFTDEFDRYDDGMYRFKFGREGALLVVQGLDQNMRGCYNLLAARSNRFFTDKMGTTYTEFNLVDTDAARDAMRRAKIPQLEILGPKEELIRLLPRYRGEKIIPMGRSRQGGTLVCVATGLQFDQALEDAGLAPQSGVNRQSASAA